MSGWKVIILRSLDISFSLLGLVVFLPLLLSVAIVGLLDTGYPIFLQVRMGKHKRPFTLIKFRTMVVSTQSVASHLAPSSSVTKFGSFLRKTKLDELPQLLNVLKGEMSLVGPRPNLLNQDELIKERECLGVYDVLPGITGLAQVENIDMSTPELLARTDQEMISDLGVGSYFKYIVMTVLGRGAGDAIGR